MGEQNPRAAKLAESPGLLHGKMARAKTIFTSHRKKKSRFKDAALAAQELAAAEEEGETTAMMFALLQEQHKAQLEAIAAANKQAMDTMSECMNALIAGQGKVVDKPTAMVPNSNTGQAPNTANRKKKVCTNCGKLVFHKPQTCYKLESNASKRYPGWKSSKVASAMV
jgi:hypothetical protein